MRTLFDDGFVMVFDPGLDKSVFQGPVERLHAGEANALLGPILGDRSVLLLDGAEHLSHRRLMLPFFHGRQLNAHVRTMRLCADEEIERWPIGKPFMLLPAMQAITLNVMLRAVFGYEPGPQRDKLAARVRSMIDPLARPRGAIALRAVLRGRDDARAAQSFEGRRRAVDDLLYAEITRRRADPALAARDDVFSTLLLARDSSDQGLRDREVRDELLAGHETTATGLAWTLDLLLHDRRVMARAQQGDPSYLDAVIKESLRVRTVIPGVGRVVREQPFSLGPFTVPPGMEINPSIRTIHRRADLYPQPRSFRPERFLRADAPDTYTWLPFGGGTRRCLGASFALTEMRIVLERILERTRLVPADRRPARTQFRLITLGPRGGVRAIQETAPALALHAIQETAPAPAVDAIQKTAPAPALHAGLGRPGGEAEAEESDGAREQRDQRQRPATGQRVQCAEHEGARGGD
jgi:cytochrome P450